MKAVVTKDERAAGGRVTENAEFLRFAHHWDFRVRACRPYRAKTKGKVERPVSYVRSSFFYGRTFTSDEDLNDQARHWLDHVANVRTHGTLKERPVDRFEHERDLLRPLASRPYRSLVLPPEVTKQAKAVLPRIDVERRPLEAYAQRSGVRSWPASSSSALRPPSRELPSAHASASVSGVGAGLGPGRSRPEQVE